MISISSEGAYATSY